MQCEKPMAMTEQECMEMMEATDKAGVKLQLAFMRRFDESFMHAKERVDAGEIGDVVCVKSLTHGPSIPNPGCTIFPRAMAPWRKSAAMTLMPFTGTAAAI